MPITYNTNRSNPLYIYRTTSGGTIFSANLTTSTAFDLFSDSAVVNDAIYFSGYSSGLIVYSNLYLTIGTALSAVDLNLVWEYYSGTGWRTCHNLLDGSNGFTTTGNIIVTFPCQANGFYVAINGITQHWIRCRIVSLTSISEGGATSTNRVQCSNGAINIEGYTDAAPCRWSTLYDWVIVNAPEIGAIRDASVYTFNNFQSINILSTLRSTDEVIFLGNGSYYQSFNFAYLWSGVKVGTDGWSNSSYYFISTRGPSTQTALAATTRIYGGSIVMNIPRMVDGVSNFVGGYSGLANGDIIGLVAPFSGYFNIGTNINKCTVGGGLITAGNPVSYPKNLLISNPGGVIWALYGNAFDCSDVNYALPAGNIMSIGANYQVGDNIMINIKNPNPALPLQTSVPKVIGRSIGALTSFDKVFYYDDSSMAFIDYTLQASDATMNDIPLSGDINDCYYFKPIAYTNSGASNLNIHFTITNQLNDYEYIWEYLKSPTNVWTKIPDTLFFDTTNNLTKSGNIYICTGGSNFPVQSTTINGIIGTWYRLRVITKGVEMPLANIVRYKQETGAGTYSVNEIYTTEFTVIGVDKNPLQGTNILITNINGSVISLITDINGKTAPTDIITSKTVFNPLAPLIDFNYVKNSLNPFTIIISKAGYETYETKIDIMGKINPVITLKPIKPIRKDIEGNVYKALLPEKGSDSKLFKL